MQQLQEISDRLIATTTMRFRRSLYDSINWDSPLIEIRGARGTGKTTLMLQRAGVLQQAGRQVLYVSSDHAWFYKNSLVELADWFFKYGGEYLFVDEVHRYPQKIKGLDWSQELKNILDSYPGLQVIYSGSSILRLYQGSGDLSRRRASYHLPGLSFREFLMLEADKGFDKLSLDDIWQKHRQLSHEIIAKVKILPWFARYLQYGYYPFYYQDPQRYYERLNDVANVILETDIPSVSDIRFETAYKFKTLLAALASYVPYTPNLKKLSGQLYISDYRTLLKYLNYLEKAELIQTIGAQARGNQLMNKPDKIYLNNTSLMHAFAPGDADKGTLRETFFMNQLLYANTVTYPKTGDFLINNTVTVEVGGRNKTQKQIANLPNAFLVQDDIETGAGNAIPLWLFGFLY